MNFAIIKASGKQYKVTPGATLRIDKIKGENGEVLSFNEVMLISKNDKVLVGTPYVRGFEVLAKVSGQVKGEKVRVSKFRAKSRYRRVMGYRPSLTQIEVVEIKGGKE